MLIVFIGACKAELYPNTYVRFTLDQTFVFSVNHSTLKLCWFMTFNCSVAWFGVEVYHLGFGKNKVYSG